MDRSSAPDSVITSKPPTCSADYPPASDSSERLSPSAPPDLACQESSLLASAAADVRGGPSYPVCQLLIGLARQGNHDMYGSLSLAIANTIPMQSPPLQHWRQQGMPWGMHCSASSFTSTSDANEVLDLPVDPFESLYTGCDSARCKPKAYVHQHIMTCICIAY